MLYVLFNSRQTGLCNIYCGELIGQYQNVFLLFPFVLILSLLTFKMSNQVFVAWWKFARVSIPVILVISTLIGMQLHHNSYGLFNMDNLFDVPVLLLMYGIFIVGSLIQIWRGYRMNN